MGILNIGWCDCGDWGDANFWRWRPIAGEIPQEAIKLLKRVERPSVEFDTELALQLIKDDCASLYIATGDNDKLLGVLMLNVSQSKRIGSVLEIEACSFLPGEAKPRWEFVQAIARENQCNAIRCVSSRPMHKTFPDLQPKEAVFYAKVK